MAAYTEDGKEQELEQKDSIMGDEHATFKDQSFKSMPDMNPSLIVEDQGDVVRDESRATIYDTNRERQNMPGAPASGDRAMNRYAKDTVGSSKSRPVKNGAQTTSGGLPPGDGSKRLTPKTVNSSSDGRLRLKFGIDIELQVRPGG